MVLEASELIILMQYKLRRHEQKKMLRRIDKFQGKQLCQTYFTCLLVLERMQRSKKAIGKSLKLCPL